MKKTIPQLVKPKLHVTATINTMPVYQGHEAEIRLLAAAEMIADSAAKLIARYYQYQPDDKGLARAVSHLEKALLGAGYVNIEVEVPANTEAA